jgi:hypothetical protein
VLAAGVLLIGACTSQAPDPPSPAALVGPGRRPVSVVSADLDGDATREVAVVSTVRAGPELPAQDLQVFALREEEWREVLDGRGPAPPGAGAPPVMLAEEGAFAAQTIDVLETVRIRPGRGAQLVVAVASFGASAGPLELWVISWDGASFRTEYYDATERGGRVTVGPQTIDLEFGVYRARDPGCCPSRIERHTIGWDEGAGRVGVLERRRERT